MRNVTWVAAAIAAVTFIHTSPVAAQQGEAAVRAHPRGFFLAAALSGTGLTGEGITDNEAESGGGLSASLGYQFGPMWALFVEGTGATMSPKGGGDQYVLGHFDAGVRLHFVKPSRSLVPYIDVAYSGRAASEDDVTIFDDNGNGTQGTLEVSGTGISFGGGLNIHTSPGFAIQTGVRWTTGDFTTVKFRNISVSGFNAHATTARVNLGFIWYPGQGGKE